MMLMSASMYFTSAEVKAGFTHLGYPSYFRVELAIAKIAGALVLILPMIKGRLKEWAYFGFFITFLSAALSHYASGDAAAKWMSALVFAVILLVSYFAYNKVFAPGSSLQKN